MQEGTTSRVMAADVSYGEFYDFYSVGTEYFGYHHVCARLPCNCRALCQHTSLLGALTQFAVLIGSNKVNIVCTVYT
jgi:hypothetical protein